MSELKLEVNKTYKNRLGDLVKVLTVLSDNEKGYFVGESLTDETERLYSSGGFFNPNREEHVYDLIEEVSGEKKKAYIVWNGDKTEGFITTSKCLSYEVRKSASTNCSTEEGRYSPVAVAFCEEWYTDNCTIEEIEINALTAEQIAEVIDIREHEKKYRENQEE